MNIWLALTLSAAAQSAPTATQNDLADALVEAASAQAAGSWSARSGAPISLPELGAPMPADEVQAARDWLDTIAEHGPQHRKTIAAARARTWTDTDALLALRRSVRVADQTSPEAIEAHIFAIQVATLAKRSDVLALTAILTVQLWPEPMPDPLRAALLQLRDSAPALESTQHKAPDAADLPLFIDMVLIGQEAKATHPKLDPLLAHCLTHIQPNSFSQYAGVCQSTAGWVAKSAGDVDQAIQHYQDAIRTAGDDSQPALQAHLHAQLAHLYRERGDHTGFIEAYRKTATYAEAAGKPDGAAVTWVVVGRADALVRDDPTACQRARALAEQVGDRLTEARALKCLAMFERSQGYDGVEGAAKRAEASGLRAFELFLDIDQPTDAIQVLVEVAEDRITAGDVDDGLGLYRRLDDIPAKAHSTGQYGAARARHVLAECQYGSVDAGFEVLKGFDGRPGTQALAAMAYAEAMCWTYAQRPAKGLGPIQRTIAHLPCRPTQLDSYGLGYPMVTLTKALELQAQLCGQIGDIPCQEEADRKRTECKAMQALPVEPSE